MAADPLKAAIWPDADVYVAPLGTTLPATAAAVFPAGWNLIGLLDGDDGITQSRDEDVNDHYAWGGILVRTSRRNFKQTVKFTALEDNAYTRELMWPGAGPAFTSLSRPRPIRQLVAFELRESTKIKRLISAYQAEIAIDGDIVDNEADLTKFTFTATIFPTAGGVLFTEQTAGTASV